MPPGLATLRSGPARSLLDLDMQGRIFRFSSGPDPVSITSSATGASLLYSPGLPDTAIPQDLGEVRGAVTVEVPALDVPWALLHARGNRFELSTATIRRWYPGQTVEQAEIVMRGRVRQPSWGGPDEPLRITVEPRTRGAGRIPHPQMRVATETWNHVANYAPDPAALGADYPVIFGEPGSDGTPSTPALLVAYAFGVSLWSACKLLIAGHEVEATTVTIFDMSQRSAPEDGEEPVSWVATVAHMDDALGRRVAVVDFASATHAGRSLVPQLGHEYRVAWTGGGGMMRADRSGALRGAGEILRHLLESWAPGLLVDVGRQEAQRAVLDAYRLDFAIAASADTWAVILDNIAPILPVRWTEGERGGYFAARRLSASLSEAVAWLDATPPAWVDRGERQVTPAVAAIPAYELSWTFESGTLDGFTTSGDALWTATNGTAAVGTWSAVSGNITHSQVSNLNLTTPVLPVGGCELTLYQSTSSESGFDFWKLYVDGVEDVSARASGATAWQKIGPFTLGAGSHTIRVAYEKDSSVDGGTDEVWTDHWVIYVPEQAGSASSVTTTASTNAPPPNCTRTTRVEVAGNVYNRIRVNYGRGGEAGRQTTSIIVDAAPDADDPRVVPDLRCALSQDLYRNEDGTPGVRDLDVTTDIVSERATAALIGGALALQYAMPRRVVGVVGGRDLDRVAINDVVAFTARDVEIREEVGIVLGKVPRDDSVDLTIELIDDPLRMIRRMR